MAQKQSYLEQFKSCETCHEIMEGILKASGDLAPRKKCHACEPQVKK